MSVSFESAPPASASPPDRPPRRRAAWWWTLAAAVIALAVGFCVWFAYPVRTPHLIRLPPGATLVGGRGISYPVLARNYLQVLDAYGHHFVAPPGAVIVEYIVQVDGYIWPGDALETSLCTFDLYGRDGLKWAPMDESSMAYRKSCRTRDPTLTSQQVASHHLVPERELAGLIGLVLQTLDDPRPDTELPVISEPR